MIDIVYISNAFLIASPTGYGGGVRGRPLPIHVGGGGGDDSDPGNNADCDDTNSVNSSYNFNKSR